VIPSDVGNWTQYIARLLYAFQFSNDIPGCVDRVIGLLKETPWVFGFGPDGLDLMGLRPAIASALASEEPVAKLIPQRHSEEICRAYLAALGARLDDPRHQLDAATDPD